MRTERKLRWKIIFAFLAIALFPTMLYGIRVDNQVKQKTYLAYAVAERAKAKIAEGEVYDALLALLEVLPSDKTDTAKPYVPQAEAALRIALDSLKSRSWKKYSLGLGREYRFSHHDKYILSEELLDSLTTLMRVYDSSTFQEKCHIKLPFSYTYLSSSQDDNCLAVGSQTDICLYDLESGKLVKSSRIGDASSKSILEAYSPIYLYRFIDEDTESTPQINALTQYFKPESQTANVQVLDYLPHRNWVLYKKHLNRAADEDINASYILWDRSSHKIL